MKYTFPAGTYYIGDPVYIVDSDTYYWFLDFSDMFQKQDSMAEYNPAFMVFPTYYGDGIYLDEEETKYPVDSGTLGCFPESLVLDPDFSELYRIVTFSEDFKVYEENGVLHFGHVVINTNEEEEEDSEYI